MTLAAFAPFLASVLPSSQRGWRSEGVTLRENKGARYGDWLPEMVVEKGAEKTLGLTVSAERGRLERSLPALGARRSRPRGLSSAAALPDPSARPVSRALGSSTVSAPRTRPQSDDTQSGLHSRVLPAARTHSMTIRCFVSQPFSMENQRDQAMIATGSFEEWDAFREA